MPTLPGRYSSCAEADDRLTHQFEADDVGRVQADPVVDALMRTAGKQFQGLGLSAPDGTLDLQVDIDGVRRVRLELPAGQVLQLQSLGIETPEPDPPPVADVVVSSWEDGYREAFSAARLLDTARPAGTVVRTAERRPAWLEVEFARPITVRRLAVRNAADATPGAADGLRITVPGRWRERVIYDGVAQLREWRSALGRAAASAAADADGRALLDVLDLTVTGNYARAHTRLAKRVRSEDRRRHFRDEVNAVLLPSRGLEWTVHGPQRPFRSWTPEERIDYVRDSAEVVDAVAGLTPNVCFGFGSVLAVVRDRALIPHDDDIDIIVGFEPTEASTLSDALGLIERHLSPLGFNVTGSFAAHRHVRRPGRKRVDVFAGLFEGSSVSWYPAARGGLERAAVFPPRAAELLNVPVRIPAKPEIYLEQVYGEGWRIPDPFFRHPWDITAYADLAGGSNSGSRGGAAASATVDGAVESSDAPDDPGAPASGA